MHSLHSRLLMARARAHDERLRDFESIVRHDLVVVPFRVNLNESQRSMPCLANTLHRDARDASDFDLLLRAPRA